MEMGVTLQVIISIILAYLIGSVPASIWIGRRFYGVDIRTAGSGNAGATNTIRVLGPKIGLAVLAIDVAKGWFAIFLARLFSFELLEPEQFVWIQILLGIAAIVGHIFPVYINFKGGKGVATTVGVCIGLFPYPVLLTSAIFFSVFFISKYVSLASIISAVVFPFVAIFVFNTTSLSLIILSIAIGVFIPIMHHKNIKRLLRGEENKFRLRKSDQPNT